MNCQRFELVVSDLTRGQMMEADVRGEALAHSDACEECAARLRDEETLTHGLQALAGEMVSLNAPVEMESRLREAFRARPFVAPASRRYASYWVAGVAAVLLLAIGIIALRWRPDQRKEETATQTEQTPIKETPRDEGRPVQNMPRKQEVALKPRRRPVRKAVTTEVANHVTREIATDFIPVGYLNTATLQDGGQIIRVELPRSRLASFGLPVNMDRYNEKVKADILLGVDGLAHAIRFVQ
jgi:hypothetical protein